MRKTIVFVSAVLVLCASCRYDQYKADISGIRLEAGITRLEEYLFEAEPGKLPELLDSLKNVYPVYMKYFGYVLHAGDPAEQGWNEQVMSFVTGKNSFEVYSSVKELYTDGLIRETEEKITDALRHYKYYFPGSKIPGVFSCITGFNNSIIVGDSAIGIGLDRYLGSDSPFYPRLGLYKYQAEKMIPERIVPDCIFGWASAEWDFDYLSYPADDVLANIIHLGKLFYFTKAMLPDYSDEAIFGFTAGQVSFCQNNEKQMWLYMMEHDILFSTDRLTITKLTGEAPFTTFFSNESPGRAAGWIGFRIVESYMKNNREVSLAQLMSDTDVSKILEKARYRPR